MEEVKDTTIELPSSKKKKKAEILLERARWNYQARKHSYNQNFYHRYNLYTKKKGNK